MSGSEPPDLDALEREILAAHDRGDEAALGGLYLIGGREILGRGDVDHGCFLLTQAYVFALKTGDHGVAAQAHALLCQHGREA